MTCVAPLLATWEPERTGGFSESVCCQGKIGIYSVSIVVISATSLVCEGKKFSLVIVDLMVIKHL